MSNTSGHEMESFIKGKTDVFIAHEWGEAPAFSNHHRVSKINEQLRLLNLKTWFDEDCMFADGRDLTSRAIESSRCVLAFITRRYYDKVNRGFSMPNTVDHCFYELNHAIDKLTVSKVIPVIMDAEIRDVAKWTGRMKVEFGDKVCIDMSEAFEELEKEHKDSQFKQQCEEIVKRVKGMLGGTVGLFSSDAYAESCKEIAERYQPTTAFLMTIDSDFANSVTDLLTDLTAKLRDDVSLGNFLLSMDFNEITRKLFSREGPLAEKNILKILPAFLNIVAVCKNDMLAAKIFVGFNHYLKAHPTAIKFFEETQVAELLYHFIFEGRPLQEVDLALVFSIFTFIQLLIESDAAFFLPKLSKEIGICVPYPNSLFHQKYSYPEKLITHFCEKIASNVQISIEVEEDLVHHVRMRFLMGIRGQTEDLELTVREQESLSCFDNYNLFFLHLKESAGFDVLVSSLYNDPLPVKATVCKVLRVLSLDYESALKLSEHKIIRILFEILPQLSNGGTEKADVISVIRNLTIIKAGFAPEDLSTLLTLLKQEAASPFDTRKAMIEVLINLTFYDEEMIREIGKSGICELLSFESMGKYVFPFVNRMGYHIEFQGKNNPEVLAAFLLKDEELTDKTIVKEALSCFLLFSQGKEMKNRLKTDFVKIICKMLDKYCSLDRNILDVTLSLLRRYRSYFTEFYKKDSEGIVRMVELLDGFLVKNLNNPEHELFEKILTIYINVCPYPKLFKKLQELDTSHKVLKLLDAQGATQSNDEWNWKWTAFFLLKHLIRNRKDAQKLQDFDFYNLVFKTAPFNSKYFHLVLGVMRMFPIPQDKWSLLKEKHFLSVCLENPHISFPLVKSYCELKPQSEVSKNSINEELVQINWLQKYRKNTTETIMRFDLLMIAYLKTDQFEPLVVARESACLRSPKLSFYLLKMITKLLPLLGNGAPVTSSFHKHLQEIVFQIICSPELQTKTKYTVQAYSTLYELLKTTSSAGDNFSFWNEDHHLESLISASTNKIQNPKVFGHFMDSLLLFSQKEGPTREYLSLSNITDTLHSKLQESSSNDTKLSDELISKILQFLSQIVSATTTPTKLTEMTVIVYELLDAGPCSQPTVLYALQFLERLSIVASPDPADITKFPVIFKALLPYVHTADEAITSSFLRLLRPFYTVNKEYFAGDESFYTVLSKIITVSSTTSATTTQQVEKSSNELVNDWIMAVNGFSESTVHMKKFHEFGIHKQVVEVANSLNKNALPALVKLTNYEKERDYYSDSLDLQKLTNVYSAEPLELECILQILLNITSESPRVLYSLDTLFAKMKLIFENQLEVSNKHLLILKLLKQTCFDFAVAEECRKNDLFRVIYQFSCFSMDNKDNLNLSLDTLEILMHQSNSGRIKFNFILAKEEDLQLLTNSLSNFFFDENKLILFLKIVHNICKPLRKQGITPPVENLYHYLSIIVKHYTGKNAEIVLLGLQILHRLSINTANLKYFARLSKSKKWSPNSASPELIQLFEEVKKEHFGYFKVLSAVYVSYNQSNPVILTEWLVFVRLLAQQEPYCRYLLCKIGVCELLYSLLLQTTSSKSADNRVLLLQTIHFLIMNNTENQQRMKKDGIEGLLDKLQPTEPILVKRILRTLRHDRLNTPRPRKPTPAQKQQYRLSTALVVAAPRTVMALTTEHEQHIYQAAVTKSSTRAVAVTKVSAEETASSVLTVSSDTAEYAPTDVTVVNGEVPQEQEEEEEEDDMRLETFEEGDSEKSAEHSSSTLRLNPKFTGSTYDLRLSEDGLQAIKTKSSHCGIFGNTAFDSGIHEWTVQCEQPKPNWSQQYWIFVGIHSNPGSFLQFVDPRRTGPLWGISVSLNGGDPWISEGRNTCRRNGGFTKGQMNPGDILRMSLNLDHGTLTIKNETLDWQHKIKNLPSKTSFFPFFDPWDCSFRLNGDGTPFASPAGVVNLAEVPAAALPFVVANTAQLLSSSLDSATTAESHEKEQIMKNNQNEEILSNTSSSLSAESVAGAGITPDMFFLSVNNLVGPKEDVIINEDGLGVTKARSSHCGIFGSVAFERGKHEWFVKCDLPQEKWSVHYWMFLGVHTDPSSFESLVGPDAHKTGPLYGISVFNHGITGNSWIANGANTCRRHAGIMKAKINPGDVIRMSLNCDAGTLKIRNETMRWKYELKDLPTSKDNVSFYPFFDPYDMSFKLNPEDIPSRHREDTIKEVAASTAIPSDAMKGSSPVEKSSAPPEFLLSPEIPNKIGDDVTVSEDGLRGIKTKASHCGIFGDKAFDSGIHEWTLQCEAREEWAPLYFIFVGVHAEPSSFQGLAGAIPHRSGPLWGISIFQEEEPGNSWISTGPKTIHWHAGIKQARMSPGDYLRVILNCDNGTMIFRNESMNWHYEMKGLPKKTALYPFFDPYDCNFILHPALPALQRFLHLWLVVAGEKIKISGDRLRAIKTGVGYCGVFGSTGFSQGVNSWTVQLEPSEFKKCTYWIFLGVHGEPESFQTLEGSNPYRTGPLWGISVSSNNSSTSSVSRISTGPNTYTTGKDIGHCQIQPGDLLKVILNSNAGTLTFQNETMNWSYTLEGVPKNRFLYPFFNPYDCSFKLNPESETLTLPVVPPAIANPVMEEKKESSDKEEEKSEPVVAPPSVSKNEINGNSGDGKQETPLSTVTPATATVTVASSAALSVPIATEQLKKQSTAADGVLSSGPEHEFLLTSSNPSIVGSDISVSQDGLQVMKTSSTHCGVFGNTAFNKGIHEWCIQGELRETWCQEYWIFVGVHSNPGSFRSIESPQTTGPLWGISVSNNLNSWMATGPNSMKTRANISRAKLNPGDILRIILNCDEGTLMIRNDTLNWHYEMKNLPLYTSFYPFFDPYDCSFRLNNSIVAPQEILAPAVPKVISVCGVNRAAEPPQVTLPISLMMSPPVEGMISDDHHDMKENQQPRSKNVSSLNDPAAAVVESCMKALEVTVPPPTTSSKKGKGKTQTTTAGSTFLLSTVQVVGDGITVSEDGLQAVKTKASHCGVFGILSFNKGIHEWSIQCEPRESWCKQYWIFLGVHSDPDSFHSLSGANPQNTGPLWGISVSNNNSSWVCNGPNTCENGAGIKEALMNPGDILKVILNCDANTLTIENETMKWQHVLKNLPRKTFYFPFFDPYDCSFSLVTPPESK
jgi:predicted DNA binding CopG/RHH family protein/TusA-related sulfurtransferase